MKILHLIHNLDRGGVEKFVLQMVSKIPHGTANIDICCRSSKQGNWDQFARESGSQVIICSMLPNVWSYHRRLTRIIADGNYDIIHSHIAGYASIEIHIAKKLGIKSVVSLHDTVDPPQNRIFTQHRSLVRLRKAFIDRSRAWALNNCDAVVAVSQAVLVARLPHGSHNSMVIYHGVDVSPAMSTHEKTSLRLRLGIPEHAFVIIHVGRFCPQKNHAAVVGIFDKATKDIPEAILLLVGNGPLLEETKRIVFARGLQDKVYFLGSRDDVESCLGISDMMIFPSLHEGFGIAVIEAGAAGIPVVASKIAPLDEIIIDGFNGFLHAVHDLDAFADSINKIASNPGYRSSLGLAAKTRVSDVFSSERMIEQYLYLYSSLTKEDSKFVFMKNSHNVGQEKIPR